MFSRRVYTLLTPVAGKSGVLESSHTPQRRVPQNKCGTTPNESLSPRGSSTRPRHAAVSAPPVVSGEPVAVAEGVYVIPDNHVPIVPHIGIVVVIPQRW